MWDHHAFGAFAVFAFLSITVAPTLNFAVGQSSPLFAGPVDPAVIEDLVLANRILADQNILDDFGHVSVRHPTNSGRYLMSRSIAPASKFPRTFHSRGNLQKAPRCQRSGAHAFGRSHPV